MKPPLDAVPTVENTTPPDSPGTVAPAGAPRRKQGELPVGPASSGGRRAANPKFNSASVRLHTAKKRAKKEW